MPWGYEIWSLLTPLNPLRVRRPHRGRTAAWTSWWSGWEPAGYTLAITSSRGVGVVGVDGLK